MLAALLVARADEEAAGWFRMSLDKDNFKRPAPVAYRMFTAIRSSWRDASLIEEHRGYPGSLAFGNPGPANGMMTRFRATPALLKICEGCGVYSRDVTDHFHLEFEMPDEVLQLTQPSRPPPETPASRQLRDEVEELNAFFAKHSLEGSNANHRGSVRKFQYSQPPMPATTAHRKS
jgi:hypothetical protein